KRVFQEKRSPSIHSISNFTVKRPMLPLHRKKELMHLMQSFNCLTVSMLSDNRCQQTSVSMASSPMAVTHLTSFLIMPPPVSLSERKHGKRQKKFRRKSGKLQTEQHSLRVRE